MLNCDALPRLSRLVCIYNIRIPLGEFRTCLGDYPPRHPQGSIELRGRDHVHALISTARQKGKSLVISNLPLISPRVERIGPMTVDVQRLTHYF